MKVKMWKNELTALINTVQGAVAKTTSLPILENILITCHEDGTVEMRGSSMELTINTKGEGQVQEPGSACVNAKLFRAIVGKLPDGMVTLKTNEKGSMTVTAKKTRMQILTLDSAQFPQPPEIQDSDVRFRFRAEGGTFKEAVSKVAFAAADQGSSNRMMGGINVHVENGKMRLTALDEFRIAIKDVPLEDVGVENKYDVTVPVSHMTELAKLMKNVKADFTISDNYFRTDFENTTVYSRILSGEYFDVEKMVVGSFVKTTVFNKTDFMDTVDRSLLFTSEMSKEPLIINFGETANFSISGMIGGFEENVEPEEVMGEKAEVVIGFNPRFLLEALKTIDDENVSIHINTPKFPALIAGEDYTHLILPVNIAG